MKESLAVVMEVSHWYKSVTSPNPNDLITALQRLAGHLVVLEAHRAEYKKQYEQIIFNGTKQGDSVARSVNKAEVQVPELYMLRRVMDAGYRMGDAIRTQISFIKSEMQLNQFYGQ